MHIRNIIKQVSLFFLILIFSLDWLIEPLEQITIYDFVSLKAYTELGSVQYLNQNKNF